MCQAYEGEHQYLVQRDLNEIRKKYDAYVNGQAPLTEDELLRLAVEKLMLEER